MRPPPREWLEESLVQFIWPSELKTCLQSTWFLFIKHTCYRLISNCWHEGHSLCNFPLKMTENEAPSHNSANSTLCFASEESKPTIRMINNTNWWSKLFGIKSISLSIRLVRPVQSQQFDRHEPNIGAMCLFSDFLRDRRDRKIGKWIDKIESLLIDLR